MDFAFYALIVTLAAIIYSILIRSVQYKFGNKKEMDEFQKKSKELNKQLNEANKRKDTHQVETLIKEQATLLGGMNKLMMGQFKVMFIILAIFFAFTWGVSQLDPTVKDDLTITLLNDGKLCDAIAGDEIFSACYAPTGAEYGSWSVDLKAMKTDGGIIGENSSYFYYNVNDGPIYVKGAKGNVVGITITPKKAALGEQVTILATVPKETTSVVASLDFGTRFYVDLPFTIPVIEVKRINETYWWFIFAALISGLVVSFVAGKISKKETDVAKPGETK